MLDLFRSGNWNENNLNPLARIHWRASLVPAAAVIPAPVAYIKVAAVKKLVVGFLTWCAWPAGVSCVCAGARRVILVENSCVLYWIARAIYIFYFEKIRVFKAGLRCEYISME